MDILSSLDLKSNQKIINAPLPSADGDLASKKYVDTAVAGVSAPTAGAGIAISSGVISISGNGKTALFGNGELTSFVLTGIKESSIIQAFSVDAGGAQSVVLVNASIVSDGSGGFNANISVGQAPLADSLKIVALYLF